VSPLLHRLLLRAYPRAFREEFGADLSAYLALQRAEPRYRGRLGPMRFWWDAGVDAASAGSRLRFEKTRKGGGTLLDTVTRDVRHALRGLMRNPAYALVFVVTLGLGIGANTAMFSAVNAVLLRPLPHADGERLVYLRQAAEGAGRDNVLFSVPEIEDYRKGASSLDAIAEFSALNFTMYGHGNPRRVRTGIVTGNYFGAMGLSALAGRTIGPEDDGPAAASVIVLSHAYWRSAFGEDPRAIGRSVEVNGRSATIVGVAEPAPPYPEQTEIWVNMATSPHHLDATMSHDRTHRMTEVFARLAPGSTVETARTETSAVMARLHEAFPEAYDAGSGWKVAVTPLKTQLTTRARPTLLLLLGTALLVLVIACANLANLTLTRVLRREHEMGIRLSLGGSRAALRRSLLVESLVLAVAGAALGLLIAFVSLDLLVRFAERFTSRASEIAFNGTVFNFALLAAVAASAFFTLVPPLPDGEGANGGLTRSGTRSTMGSGGRRTQQALVVAQVAMSFVLLVGAGLLLRTMMHLNRIDPGFDTAGILAMNIPVDFGAGGSPAEVRSRQLGILEDVQALPGVEGAALTSGVPMRGGAAVGMHMEMEVEDHEPPAGAPTPRADFRVVSPGYFATMGIELLRGREFVTTDVEDAQKVVVVNESMARTWFGDEDPIGRRIAWTDDNFRFVGIAPELRTIVGLVADTRDAGLDEPVVHTIYMPHRQVIPWITGSLVVRAAGDPNAVLPAVREAILARDPTQVIDRVATLERMTAESVAPRRLNALLLGGFALLALVIAAVGIGGLLAFSVGSRRREFGVRTALGAARYQIWAGVLAEGALLAGIGVGLGALAGVGLSRVMSSLLFGVEALDPVTFVGVGVLLGAVTVVAAWAPAWRAAHVAPLEALSTE
jgi:putative ABC transport system permease protein